MLVLTIEQLEAVATPAEPAAPPGKKPIKTGGTSLQELTAVHESEATEFEPDGKGGIQCLVPCCFCHADTGSMAALGQRANGVRWYRCLHDRCREKKYREWKLHHGIIDSETTFARTDLGNAEHMSHHFGRDILWLTDECCWYAWDGRRWAPDSDGGTVAHLANLAARRRYAEASDIEDKDERKAAVAWALQSESAARRDACVRQAQTLPQLRRHSRELDTDPWLLTVHNGTLDLRTRTLRPHRREDLITKMAGCAYDPKARSQDWEDYLQAAQPNPEMRGFLAANSGYSLTGITVEEIMPVHLGPGRNGKGVFAETRAAAMGEYATSLKAEVLLRKHSTNPDGANPDIADLRGARYVRASEADEGRKLDEALVKSLTGGDPLRGRQLYRSPIEFIPCFKLELATNHKPKVTGTDSGIWSRLVLVPWDVSFVGREDKGLKARLKTPQALSGVLNWSLDGLEVYLREGLRRPEPVVEATGAYRQESDLVGQYIADRCILTPSAKAWAADLYREYVSWTGGEGALSQRRFGEALARRGLQRHKSCGLYQWVGIGLVTRDVEGTEGGTGTTSGVIFPNISSCGISHGGLSPKVPSSLDEQQYEIARCPGLAGYPCEHGRHVRVATGCAPPYCADCERESVRRVDL